MPINAHIFRIFVASSGDLKQEREIIKNLVQEWNYILRPLRNKCSGGKKVSSAKFEERIIRSLRDMVVVLI